MENAPARLMVEFVGTFAQVLFGAGVLLSGGDLAAIALANGFAILISVAAFRHISGGAFNPAVTIALWATKRLPAIDAIAYMVFQLLGGLIAGLFLKATYGTFAQNVGVPSLAQPISPFFGLLVEIIITFILMLVIMGVAVDGRSSFDAVAAIPIGFTVACGILFAGPLTGGAMNPARWFGPAVASGQYVNFWIWIVGPIVGALLAAFVYDILVKPKK
ncbi:MAG: MIP/aquaporin family protein [Actinomycetes bacterium]